MNYVYDATNALNRATRKMERKTSELVQSFSYKKDKYKTLMQLVKDHDYPIEKHFYTTEDGYINTVFRISGPRGTTAQ